VGFAEARPVDLLSGILEVANDLGPLATREPVV
jgi:hypothetical protein